MTINYLNSIGVAMKLASITLGAWQRDLSAAIAIPHRKTAAPVQKQSHMLFSQALPRQYSTLTYSHQYIFLNAQKNINSHYLNI